MNFDLRRHISLDTESLGLLAGSVVAQISACTLDMKNTFDFRISVEASKHFGFFTQPETERFWSEQPKELQEWVLGGDANPAVALIRLGDWISTVAMIAECEIKDLYIWANHTEHDFPLLKSYYSKFALDIPWHYRSPKDYSTITALYSSVSRPERKTGIAHDAMSDAVVQGQHLVNIFNYINCIPSRDTGLILVENNHGKH